MTFFQRCLPWQNLKSPALFICPGCSTGIKKRPYYSFGCAKCNYTIEDSRLYYDRITYSFFEQAVLNKFNLSKDTMIHLPRTLNTLYKIDQIAKVKGFATYYDYMSYAYPNAK